MTKELTQEQEMALAYKQKSQPICVYCNKPLDEVRQEQNDDIVWKWDERLRQHEKSTDGTVEAPLSGLRQRGLVLRRREAGVVLMAWLDHLIQYSRENFWEIEPDNVFNCADSIYEDGSEYQRRHS